MNKKDCKIIQDLLPNYVENLTNDETKEYIEEHIKECKECEKMYINMKKDFYKQETQEKVNVNFLKKHKKKIKILKAIILSIMLIYFAVVVRRTIIMVQLSEKANANRTIDNYYARLYSYQGDTLIITETFNNGEDYLTKMNWYSKSIPDRKLIFYKKGDEKINLSEVGDKKYTLNNENMIGTKVNPITFTTNGFLANLQYAFIIGIDATYCNGKQCYIIKGNGYERYIDKETGLAVREISKSSKNYSRDNDMVVDYKYEFDVVKDNDIQKPDISGAIINNL